MPRLFIVIMDMIKNKKGLTLVELIVVIAIMAVLAGTIAGVTVSQLDKQKKQQRSFGSQDIDEKLQKLYA